MVRRLWSTVLLPGLFLGACTEKREGDGPPTAAVDSGGDVSTSGSGTGDSTPDDSADSAAPVDTGSPLSGSVAAELRLGGVKTCAHPTERAALGPFAHLEGALDEAGLPSPPETPVGAGLTAGDFNGDGHLDLLLAQHEGMDLFLGDGTGALSFATDRLPPPREAGSNHAASVAADFDGDGDLDVVIANRSAGDELWWNDGSGTFTRDDTAPFAEDARSTVGASLADVDGDGDLDLFLAGHTDGPAREGADASALYLWDDGAFADAPGALPSDTHAGFTFNGTWFDADLDGDADLLMVNDHGHITIPNQLLRNDASEEGVAFSHIRDAGLDRVMLAMGVALINLNNDAWPDLLVTNFGQLALFESLGDGTWYDSAVSRGLVQNPETQIVGWSVVAEDFDNDADVDVWTTFGSLPAEVTSMENPYAQPDALWLQEAGSFTDVAPAWGLDDDAIGRGGLAIDLNEDGFLDLVTAPLVTLPRLHLSRCDASSWLQVSLEAPGPNPAAIGAVVTVQAEDRIHRRWVVAGGTQMYGSPPASVHVGLGSAAEVAELHIQWPDGETSVVGPVPANQKVTVVRTE